jgi:hypothetical protein
MKQYDAEGNEIKVDEKTDKERRAAFEAISKKAILVNMSRKQISNMPFDVNTSNKVATLLKVTDPNMLQVRKLLFNPDHLAKTRSLINDALLMVWNHTRPWDNIGYRLLPMAYYDDFNETFGKIKDEFEEAVREFIDNYDSYVKESKKVLGKAFDKNDYPAKDQLKQFFNLEIHTSQFPDIDDIRLCLSGPELVSMQQDITEQYESTIAESIATLAGMVEDGNFNRDEVGNLIKVIDGLNIGNSPEVEMKLSEIRENLNKAGIVFDETKEDESDEGMMVMDDIIEDAENSVNDDDMDELMDEYL